MPQNNLSRHCVSGSKLIQLSVWPSTGLIRTAHTGTRAKNSTVQNQATRARGSVNTPLSSIMYSIHNCMFLILCDVNIIPAVDICVKSTQILIVAAMIILCNTQWLSLTKCRIFVFDHIKDFTLRYAKPHFHLAIMTHGINRCLILSSKTNYTALRRTWG